MYRFTQPNGRNNTRDHATEALVWDNKVIDNEISGFRTLSVEGRESVSYDVLSESRSQDGDIEYSSSLAGKTIKVNFLMENDNVRDFNANWYALKAIVTGSKQRFTFADEPNEYRIGTVKAISIDKAGSLTSTGSIEIYQSNPYVYNEPVNSAIIRNGSNPLVLDDLDIIIPLRPNTVTVTFYQPVGSPNIVFKNERNVDYHLQATVNVKSGDVFKFDLLKGTGYLNNKLVKGSVSLSSDMGQLKISRGTYVDNNAQLIQKIEYSYSNKRI